MAQLPKSFTNIQQISLPKDDIHVPALNTNSALRPTATPLEETLNDAYDWLSHALELLAKETTDTNDWISWAAYNANKLG